MLTSETSDAKFQCVVYDTDVARREFLAEALKLAGVICEICYSSEKLRLIIERQDERQGEKPVSRKLVVLHPEELSTNTGAPGHSAHIALAYDGARLSDPKQRESYLSYWLNHKSVYFSPAQPSREVQARSDLILIGSSTGGIPVVHDIVDSLQLQNSTIVLCQHISEGMSGSLLGGIARRARCPVIMVDQPTELKKGQLFVLAGNFDYRLVRRQESLFLEQAVDTQSIYHPSFDVLIESLLPLQGLRSSCVVLSGLGNDGAKFLVNIKAKGVHIIAQDPGTAVADAMPSAAIQTGAVNAIYSVAEIRSYLRRVAS
ncbi:MAG: hypothetical protein A2070_12210 [Bdellovibrionales bacterium GWC1_52_8]|nr:MAG: hypothetical protein A2Z97_11620 [Bdellovibrionales bacterium GWB1_52_6]OFZ03915.1 MAG: hypothetical protein A2X97_16105 [Bdellovibrionales bacterium GWA1_52_35]OFZ37409.1 MAG: hypothetical protein A2070_12210 [Bdellovibrionales bacterium GWC1_52_8]